MSARRRGRRLALTLALLAALLPPWSPAGAGRRPAAAPEVGSASPAAVAERCAGHVCACTSVGSCLTSCCCAPDDSTPPPPSGEPAARRSSPGDWISALACTGGAGAGLSLLVRRSPPPPATAGLACPLDSVLLPTTPTARPDEVPRRTPTPPPRVPRSASSSEP